MNLWDLIMLKIRTAFNAHKADANAHHTAYTDVQAAALIADHTAIPSAHHTKYTDAEVSALIATHTAITDAHHARYTDAEAVSACDVSNDFMERGAINVCTGTTVIKREEFDDPFWVHSIASGQIAAMSVIGGLIESTSHTYNTMLGALGFPILNVKGTDKQVQIGGIVFIKMIGQNDSYVDLKLADTSAATISAIRIYTDKIDLLSHTIKDIKNHADATLSGTPKIIELDIGGTPYYIKAYPTKT